MKLRQTPSAAALGSSAFKSLYFSAFLCLAVLFCCNSFFGSSTLVSADTKFNNPNVYDSNNYIAQSKGHGAKAGSGANVIASPTATPANAGNKDKPAGAAASGEGIKCGDNTGFINVNGMNVAQQVVNTEGEDLSEIVRREIEKHAPECNCNSLCVHYYYGGKDGPSDYYSSSQVSLHNSPAKDRKCILYFSLLP